MYCTPLAIFYRKVKNSFLKTYSISRLNISTFGSLYLLKFSVICLDDDKREISSLAADEFCSIWMSNFFETKFDELSGAISMHTITYCRCLRAVLYLAKVGNFWSNFCRSETKSSLRFLLISCLKISHLFFEELNWAWKLRSESKMSTKRSVRKVEVLILRQKLWKIFTFFNIFSGQTTKICIFE